MRPFVEPPVQLLIIRFSSLGDIAQCLSAADRFKQLYPHGHVTWIVRSDFADFVKLSPNIDEVVSFSRSAGLLGLIQLGRQFAKTNFAYVYDAHNNVRSHFLMGFIRFFNLMNGHASPQFVRRSKMRWRRFLFFYLGWPVLPQPFRGMQSFLQPLQKYWPESDLPPAPKLKSQPKSPPFVSVQPPGSAFSNFILLAPSAAWALKRWPLEHFKKIVQLLPDRRFVLVGGPQDHFLQELAQIAPDRVQNLAGKLSWQESTQLIAQAQLVVSNDTGTLHIADWLGRKSIALIGPTAFGYPSRSTSTTLEIPLPCKPCSKDGRGRCKNTEYQKCLVDLRPERVVAQIQDVLR
jgi:heptosyltransferase-2